MKAKLTTFAKPVGLFQDRKVFVLLGILILTVIVIIYQSAPTPVLSTGSSKSTSKLKTTESPGSLRGKVKEDPINTSDSVVIFSELQQKTVEFPGEKRNIFSFYVPPPPPTVAKVVNIPPPPKPVCGDRMCQPGETYDNCSSDCPPPPPPPIDLKYIGYLREPEGAVAFLTDGKEVFMGRVNDIIANKYRVIRITDESVELGYVNLTTNQSKTIPFEGNLKS